MRPPHAPNVLRPAPANERRLYADGWRDKASCYKQVCRYLFENILQDGLLGAHVKIDANGNQEFNTELASYLRRRINGNTPDTQHIKKVKSVDSKGNNLIQLADMVCGAIARSYNTNKGDAHTYRNIVASRIQSCRVWP